MTIKKLHVMKLFLSLLIPLFLFADAHIFVMHRIDDMRYPSTDTSTKELVKYFTYINKHHYKAIKLSTLVKMMKEKKNLNKIVVFTIDDTFESFFKNGLKIFKKYHIPFTLFVYTQATNEHFGDYMTWKQVRECEKYGELGVHSYAHPHLVMLTNKQIIKDTRRAIKLFKKHIGYVPDMYAYPYGEYNKRVKKIIHKYFKIIANQNVGAITLDTPIDDLDRIALTGKVDIAKKLKLTRLHVKDLKILKDNNIIKEVSGYVKLPYVNIYITTLGYKGVEIVHGFFKYIPNFKLTKYRNRVVIRYRNALISRFFIR